MGEFRGGGPRLRTNCRPPAVVTTAAVGTALVTSPVHKIKLNNVIDQGGETGGGTTGDQNNFGNQDYIATTGGLPKEDAQYTFGLITALSLSNRHRNEPSANFGVFGPYY